MKFLSKIKHIIRNKALVIPALCALIAISSTAVVFADEITAVAAYVGEAATSEEQIQSEETKKEEFIDPKVIIFEASTEETVEKDDTTENEGTIEEAPEETKVEYPLGNQIADYAYSFVGWLPYVWGGDSLVYGADCCGFTMAVYRDFGIEIPRTVEGQSATGYSVSLEEALPGDIVIYYGHVGLYAGDGMVIHLPYPGECVTYTGVYVQDILDIRRIV